MLGLPDKMQDASLTLNFRQTVNNSLVKYVLCIIWDTLTKKLFTVYPCFFHDSGNALVPFLIETQLVHLEALFSPTLEA